MDILNDTALLNKLMVVKGPGVTAGPAAAAAPAAPGNTTAAQLANGLVLTDMILVGDLLGEGLHPTLAEFCSAMPGNFRVNFSKDLVATTNPPKGKAPSLRKVFALGRNTIDWICGVFPGLAPLFDSYANDELVYFQHPPTVGFLQLPLIYQAVCMRFSEWRKVAQNEVKPTAAVFDPLVQLLFLNLWYQPAACMGWSEEQAADYDLPTQRTLALGKLLGRQPFNGAAPEHELQHLVMAYCRGRMAAEHIHPVMVEAAQTQRLASARPDAVISFFADPARKEYTVEVAGGITMRFTDLDVATVPLFKTLHKVFYEGEESLGIYASAAAAFTGFIRQSNSGYQLLHAVGGDRATQGATFGGRGGGGAAFGGRGAGGAASRGAWGGAGGGRGGCFSGAVQGRRSSLPLPPTPAPTLGGVAFGPDASYDDEGSPELGFDGRGGSSSARFDGRRGGNVPGGSGGGGSSGYGNGGYGGGGGGFGSSHQRGSSSRWAEGEPYSAPPKRQRFASPFTPATEPRGQGGAHHRDGSRSDAPMRRGGGHGGGRGGGGGRGHRAFDGQYGREFDEY